MDDVDTADAYEALVSEAKSSMSENRLGEGAMHRFIFENVFQALLRRVPKI